MGEPTRRELRSFGLTVGGVLLALGGWWLHRGKFAPLVPFLLGLGGVLFLLGAAAPGSLALPRRAWMRLAEALGAVTTTVILTIVFYLVVTPTGVLRRLLGADPLRRREFARGPGSARWRPYPSRHLDTRHYEKTW